MGLEAASQRPARMSIANLATGESVEAQFNPTQLEEALEVNWARQTVPGLSREPLQFVSTGNTKFQMELNFEALEPGADLDQLLRSRRFLLSLCYPPAGSQDVASGGPPRALFVWPGIVSLTCVIASVSFKYTRFNVAGTPTQFTARIGLEEITDIRLTSEDVLADGTQRSSAALQEV